MAEHVPLIVYLLGAQHGATFDPHNNPVRAQDLKTKNGSSEKIILARDHSVRSESSPRCEACNSVIRLRGFRERVPALPVHRGQLPRSLSSGLYYLFR